MRLSQAENQAIALLTPPRPIVAAVPAAAAVVPPPPLPPVPSTDTRTQKQKSEKWKQVATAAHARLQHGESLTEVRKILAELERNPQLRLSINWSLEEVDE
jgi:hypothetical protein